MASVGRENINMGSGATDHSAANRSLPSSDNSATAGVAGSFGTATVDPGVALRPPRRMEDMSPQEIIQMLPPEDRHAISRVAAQGRWTGLFTAAATGAGVYRALKRRGTAMPAVGAVLLGLTLGYPLGVSLTVAFNGSLLRRISGDILEIQRRNRDAHTGSAAGYDSTFPASQNWRPQQQTWGSWNPPQPADQQANWSDTRFAEGSSSDSASGLMYDKWGSDTSSGKSSKDEILKE
uniref:Putative transmembrane protein n=1 Tax=Toxoplasma gondii COUG TaxID=1074873 RepID=A0A2G8YE34_TOXGO|nr:putative transmembrane protein [Toxoplasma gondii COUG]